MSGTDHRDIEDPNKEQKPILNQQKNNSFGPRMRISPCNSLAMTVFLSFELLALLLYLKREKEASIFFAVAGVAVQLLTYMCCSYPINEDPNTLNLPSETTTPFEQQQRLGSGDNSSNYFQGSSSDASAEEEDEDDEVVLNSRS